MALYQVIRINIIATDTKSETEDNLEIQSDKIVNDEEQSQSTDISSFDTNDTPQIKLNIIDNPKINMNTIVDEQEYVTIIPCYHFNVTGSRIDNIDMNYLIGTNIITIGSDKLITVPINSKDDVKYKKIVRNTCKSKLGLKNKDIITIKHINNQDNYHNYLVLLNKSKSLSTKYKNSMNCASGTDFHWRTYFGIYYPEKINPSKAEVYKSISEYKCVDTVLKMNNNDINLRNIYKSISNVIGEDTY